MLRELTDDELSLVAGGRGIWDNSYVSQKNASNIEIGNGNLVVQGGAAIGNGNEIVVIQSNSYTTQAQRSRPVG
jgi:hypothetical protein